MPFSSYYLPQLHFLTHAARKYTIISMKKVSYSTIITSIYSTSARYIIITLYTGTGIDTPDPIIIYDLCV